MNEILHNRVGCEKLYFLHIFLRAQERPSHHVDGKSYLTTDILFTYSNRCTLIVLLLRLYSVYYENKMNKSTRSIRKVEYCNTSLTLIWE